MISITADKIHKAEDNFWFSEDIEIYLLRVIQVMRPADNFSSQLYRKDLWRPLVRSWLLKLRVVCMGFSTCSLPNQPFPYNSLRWKPPTEATGEKRYRKYHGAVKECHWLLVTGLLGILQEMVLWERWLEWQFPWDTVETLKQNCFRSWKINIFSIFSRLEQFFCPKKGW